jgi:hypothetical protein
MSKPEQLWDVTYQSTVGDEVFRHLESGALVSQLMDAWIQCTAWCIGSWLYRVHDITIDQVAHQVHVTVALLGADPAVDVC